MLKHYIDRCDAISLKALGFNEPTEWYYDESGYHTRTDLSNKSRESIWNLWPNHQACPEVREALDWLEQTFNLAIHTTPFNVRLGRTDKHVYEWVAASHCYSHPEFSFHTNTNYRIKIEVERALLKGLLPKIISKRYSPCHKCGNIHIMGEGKRSNSIITSVILTNNTNCFHM